MVQPIRPVMMEEVRVDGRRWDAGTAGGLRVKSGAARFEFHYTTPSLLNPGRLRFRYRLDGLDSDWVDAGGQRAAHYNHLPPGNYAFRVMAGGTDGVWHEIAQPLTLQVVPRVWERGWAKVSAGLLVLIALALTVRQMERNKLRRRLQELEAQRALERERRRIAQDLHDDIGAHLTRLNLDCELAGRETVPTTDLRSHLAGMNRKVNQLIRAMDEIVWAVNPKHDTLDSVVTYLGRFAQSFLSSAGLRCRLDVPLNLPPWTITSESRHNLYLTLKEALNNVIKHASATEVRICLELRPEGFTLAIIDNGCGFDSAGLTPATNPAEPLRNASGNGLANMQKRMEEIGGRCEWQTAKGEGTRVILTLPVK